MIKELLATLEDWRQSGDLAGHLRAWLAVALGLVTPEDRVLPACSCRPEAQEEDQQASLTGQE